MIVFRVNSRGFVRNSISNFLVWEWRSHPNPKTEVFIKPHWAWARERLPPPSSNMMRGMTRSPLDHGGDGLPLWLSPQTIIACTCHLLHLFSKLVVELAREAQSGDLYFRFCVTYIDALSDLWACSDAIPLLIWWTLYCLLIDYPLLILVKWSHYKSYIWLIFLLID